jgi:hypothetical protein
VSFVRRVIEHQRHQVVAADPVHHAVVDLGQDGPATAFQPVQQPFLPQRPAPVQPQGEEPGHGGAELLRAARRRHCGLADMVPDREVLVVGPRRADELERHGPDHLAVPGHPRQLRLEQPHEVLAGGGRAVEHRDRADVHGRVVVFGVEELGIERAHPIHR